VSEYRLESQAMRPIDASRILGGVRGRRRIDRLKICAAVHIYCDKTVDRSTEWIPDSFCSGLSATSPNAEVRSGIEWETTATQWERFECERMG
jgi:hypothetical protein